MAGACEPGRVRSWAIEYGEEAAMPYSMFRVVQTGESYSDVGQGKERGLHLGCLNCHSR